MPFFQEREPGLLEEIADTRTGAKYIENEPNPFVVPQSKETIKTTKSTNSYNR